MRKIKLYYHFFIPPDHRAGGWHWWVDQQLGIIRDSGLANIAEVKMCITMPRFWTEMFGITIYTHSVQNPISFEEKVKEYISLRYPFVQILDVRDTNDSNIFEGHTLHFLYEDAKHDDYDVCYIQNKGAISGFTPHVANWRDILNYCILTKWTENVKKLEVCDLLGVADRTSTNNLLSGNFWWAKSEYIRQLPEPLNSQYYMTEPAFFPYNESYRYAFEHWVGKANPNLLYIVQTHADHYSEYCFLEDFIALHHKIKM